ncbi:1-deoxy-D-xylulose-5-phosphate synthase [Treponema primitia ZAS-2]|uniref:1-deoxy-D-xylulose-5-phosphate synthase n=1 Tax=Treponema primitia (strain ATCC BAA-887 / DSM 12427 / ZAS-2) TaxID=545694 RepID=F5YKJ9_TREPZ|nr:1-deoxy-D-xylulose-5-phosphate synthase [Treponema primitia]AEF84181.1 1-deoxy-D-xylulose-5-phosphate synthase [Treponema primitia ZAS-2]
MQEYESVLARIQDPGDLKKLSFSELNRLASEIRSLIVSTVSRNGGHLSSNLGVVELTIALHRVFDSPGDKIIWDVGHQCYTHKLLTGRREDFSTLRKSGGLAGFPKTSESPHDAFNTGHASTSISAALGLLAGERLKGGKNRVIALIGDGALTGGMAYEALSHAGQLALPLVVILNDNKMSIGSNVGGLSKYLSRLSMKGYYQSFRRNFDAMAKRLPFIGDIFFAAVVRMKRAVKAIFYTDNFFVDLGFEYVGPIDGHQIQRLTEVLQDVRTLNRPVVVHVITRKGKGYDFAEHDPGSYHGVGSFSVSDGILESPVGERRLSFTDAFSRAILEAGRRDSRVLGISAAMGKGTGLLPFKKEFPDRYFDTGIAEGHAVTFAAGLAAQGLRPVAAIYSTFMQRGVDQLIHDVCLQKLPVCFALDRSGFVSDDGETHQGLFDIALFRSIPNLSILAPGGEGELKAMLDWSLEEPGPCMIRYPKSACPEEPVAFAQPLERGRGVLLPRGEGSRICLCFTGSLYTQALEAAEFLSQEGIQADLYNLRFLKPVDEDYLAALMNRYDLMVFIEEGIKNGGFGEYAAELGNSRFCSGKILILAALEGFVSQGKRDELLRRAGLHGLGIATAVSRAYKAALGVEWALGSRT